MHLHDTQTCHRKAVLYSKYWFESVPPHFMFVHLVLFTPGSMWRVVYLFCKLAAVPVAHLGRQSRKTP